MSMVKGFHYYLDTLYIFVLIVKGLHYYLDTLYIKCSDGIALLLGHPVYICVYSEGIALDPD